MSDQSKPMTDEWWTEQDVDGCWHIGVSNRAFAEVDETTAKAITDAHNAALAAEREKVQTYEDALIKIANDPNCDRCQAAVDALAKVGK